MNKIICRDVVENSKNINHPAIFPLTLIENMIQLLSNEGDLVLDPFCGSEQTYVAAQKLRRNLIKNIVK